MIEVVTRGPAPRDDRTHVGAAQLAAVARHVSPHSAALARGMCAAIHRALEDAQASADASANADAWCTGEAAGVLARLGAGAGPGTLADAYAVATAAAVAGRLREAGRQAVVLVTFEQTPETGLGDSATAAGSSAAGARESIRCGGIMPDDRFVPFVDGWGQAAGDATRGDDKTHDNAAHGDATHDNARQSLRPFSASVDHRPWLARQAARARQATPKAREALAFEFLSRVFSSVAFVPLPRAAVPGECVADGHAFLARIACEVRSRRLPVARVDRRPGAPPGGVPCSATLLEPRVWRAFGALGLAASLPLQFDADGVPLRLALDRKPHAGRGARACRALAERVSGALDRWATAVARAGRRPDAAISRLAALAAHGATRRATLLTRTQAAAAERRARLAVRLTTALFPGGTRQELARSLVDVVATLQARQGRAGEFGAALVAAIAGLDAPGHALLRLH